MQDIRLTAIAMACLALFPSYTNAFWRLPCRGRSGLARLDPIVEPDEVSGHVHAVHGGGSKRAFFPKLGYSPTDVLTYG